MSVSSVPADDEEMHRLCLLVVGYASGLAVQVARLRARDALRLGAIALPVAGSVVITLAPLEGSQRLWW